MISPIQQIESLYQRLAKARQLVEAGKVHQILGQDGYFAVQASTEGFYLVNGTCTCPDAQQREELHKGWCKHKLAVELVKESESKPDSELEDKLADLYQNEESAPNLDS